MMTTRCTECQGRRVIARIQPEIKRSQGMDYFTGRKVERLYQCERCGGSGVDPEPTSFVTYAGGMIDAPGFTSETFASGVEKAIGLGTLHMTPARGSVLVESARSDAQYAVTRTSCSCPGHRSHGHCYHRAAVLYCADVWGIDVHRERILGFDAEGWPVTAAERRHALQEVAS